MHEEQDTYLNRLLKHHEQMPSWYKDRLREIAGLDDKFEKSEEPLWKTKAFISSYRDMVFNSMVAHTRTCKGCYEKMNSIYLHCSEIEKAKLDPKVS